MTAAELVSFRTLLQAQDPPAPRPDGALFARMRARLTIVERTDAPAAASSRATPVDQSRPELEPGPERWDEPDAPVARPEDRAHEATSPAAGWIRPRPAGTRRVLQRLEAVLTAELDGLDARIATDAPAP